MIGWLKRAWHDPVGSKVISSGILALLAAPFIFAWWESVLALIVLVWTFLGSTSTLPNWLLGILFLISASAIMVVLIAVFDAASSKNSKPSQMDYVEDSIFEIRWRWSYYGGSIKKPIPFCPRCDCQIIPTNSSYYAAVPEISLNCDDCGQFKRSFQGDFDDLQIRTILQIQKNLRSGEWAIKAKQA